jgi:hypothetical protein
MTNFVTMARIWGLRPPLHPGTTCVIGALQLDIPEFLQLAYWFPPQVIVVPAAITEAAHRCRQPHLEHVALISLSACIIAKWSNTLSYAMDIDRTRPHRRVHPLTLDHVLTTYLRRLDRTLACLGQLHQIYHEASVLNTVQHRSRVIYPHDAAVVICGKDVSTPILQY